MKKKRKKVASSTLSIYVTIMRRLLLNNLCWMVLVLATASAFGGEAFLLLKDGTDFQSARTAVQDAGVRVRQSIPPRILIVHFDGSPTFTSVVSQVYARTVPIGEMKALGPIAVAAAIHFNESWIADQRESAPGKLASAAASAGAASFPSPSFTAEIESPAVLITVDSVWGASSYEIELGADPAFSDIYLHSFSALPAVKIPIPVSDKNPGEIYVRVRALGRVEGDAPIQMPGEWSTAKRLAPIALLGTQPNPVPALVSPLDGYESEGFTLFLEWAAHGLPATRVQFSDEKTFSRPIVDVVVENQEFQVPSSLLTAERRYYWRIQPIGPAAGPWSETRTLTPHRPEPAGPDVFLNPEAPR